MPYATTDGAKCECSADIFDDAVGTWIAVGNTVISHCSAVLLTVYF
jgi:hypothetical protein